MLADWVVLVVPVADFWLVRDERAEGWSTEATGAVEFVAVDVGALETQAAEVWSDEVAAVVDIWFVDGVAFMPLNEVFVELVAEIMTDGSVEGTPGLVGIFATECA